jgi:hypothetical protein
MIRIVIVLTAFLAAACGSGGSTRPVPPDSVMPVIAAPADLSRLPEGAVRATIGFGRVVAEAAALLDRHGARVYEVWLMVGNAPSTHELPDGRPAGVERGECVWGVRMRAKACHFEGGAAPSGSRYSGAD